MMIMMMMLLSLRNPLLGLPPVGRGTLCGQRIQKKSPNCCQSMPIASFKASISSIIYFRSSVAVEKKKKKVRLSNLVLKYFPPPRTPHPPDPPALVNP